MSLKEKGMFYLEDGTIAPNALPDKICVSWNSPKADLKMNFADWENRSFENVNFCCNLCKFFTFLSIFLSFFLSFLSFFLSFFLYLFIYLFIQLFIYSFIYFLILETSIKSTCVWRPSGAMLKN